MSSDKVSSSNANADIKQQNRMQADERFDEQIPLPSLVRQAKIDLRLLTPESILHLQRTVGNQAVQRMQITTSLRRIIQRAIKIPLDTVGFTTSFTKDEMQDIIEAGAINLHLENNPPKITETTPDAFGGTTFRLSWENAIELTDGSKYALSINMHLRGESSTLDGGGVWIDGGPANHDINVNAYIAIKRICLEWIKGKYPQRAKEDSWKV